MLATWSPADAPLGFQLIQTDALQADGPYTAVPAAHQAVLRPGPWWQQPMPAWAQAVAAVLIFAAGAALGALRGTHEVTGSVTSAAAGAVPASASAAASASDLAALEQRLRAAIGQVQLSAPHGPEHGPAESAGGGPTAGSPGLGGISLQQVRALIQESEQRQQRELTLRAAEVIRDVDAQRRGDLARIERTFGQMEGNTGVQVQQQQQMLNYLMRVSQHPPQ